MDPSLPANVTSPISNLKPNKKSLIIAGSILAILVVVVVLFVLAQTILRGSGSGKGSVVTGNGPNYNALASCSSSNKAALDHSPVDLSNVDQIVPLGQVGVPDHTLPTDHMYFSLKHPGGSPTETVKTPIVSPGKIVVITIQNSGEKKNGIQTTNDYSVSFATCQGVTILFGHVETLTGKLADAVKDKTWDKPCDIRNPAVGEETFYCTKSTDIVLDSGEAIGTVGGPGIGAFDLDADDKSVALTGAANPNRYPDTYRTCGLNFFNSDTQKLLYAMVRRTAEPRCGQIVQDKQGTTQGAWFSTQNIQEGMSDWNSNLSLIHHDIDPTLGVLAVGGKISSPMVFLFTPTHFGTINREPSEITPGSTVYCFFSNSTAYSTGQNPPSGSVILQLTDASTMKVEHQDKSCSSSSTLTNPTTYYR